jgi:hypothetical protein
MVIIEDILICTISVGGELICTWDNYSPQPHSPPQVIVDLSKTFYELMNDKLAQIVAAQVGGGRIKSKHNKKKDKLRRKSKYRRKLRGGNRWKIKSKQNKRKVSRKRKRNRIFK